MVSQVKLGDIEVDVVLKDIKNVHLSVHPPTGRVRISAPKRMRIDTIRVFAISKLDWIKRQQTKLRAQVTLQELRLQSRGVLLRVEARLRGAGGALAFRRDGRRLLLMGPADELDAAKAMADNDVELYIRSLDDGSEYAIRTDARTRLERAREGGVTPVQTMVAWVSPGRGAAGGPLPPGDWEVLVKVSAAGFSANSRVRREGEEAPVVLTVDRRGWLAEQGTPVTLRQRVGRRHPSLARAVRRARATAGA